MHRECTGYGLLEHCFFLLFADRLLELTNKPPEPRTFSMSLTEHFRYLKRLLDDPNFSEIMLPAQSAMTVTLPAESDINGTLSFISNTYQLANITKRRRLTADEQLCYFFIFEGSISENSSDIWSVDIDVGICVLP